MKKKMFIIVLIALIAILIVGIMYLIDKRRMEDNKGVIISTWENDYAPPESNYIVNDETPNDATEGETNLSEYNSFVGTILEETTTYMIVEPNKDEDESRSSDKIVINYGCEYSCCQYGVGRKVVIYYTGYIMETYPAQINTDKISVQGYEGFEITVKEADKVEGITILNNKDLYKNNSDFNLNYYGLNEVNVKVDDQEMSLEEALESGKITLDGIIAKANKDFPSVICYEDGESMEYHYDTYTIIKCHTLDGNRDVWIGIPQMTLNSIN